jgi:hypothetical protein
MRTGVSERGGLFEAGDTETVLGAGAIPGAANSVPYDISADGQRFLVSRPVETGPRPITLLVNWRSSLNR